jgi:hypothetical protein
VSGVSKGETNKFLHQKEHQFHFSWKDNKVEVINDKFCERHKRLVEEAAVQLIFNPKKGVLR